MHFHVISDCIILEGPTALHFCWLIGKHGLCVGSGQCIELLVSLKTPDLNSLRRLYLALLNLYTSCACITQETLNAQARKSLKHKKIASTVKEKNQTSLHLNHHQTDSLRVLTSLRTGVVLVPDGHTPGITAVQDERS